MAFTLHCFSADQCSNTTWFYSCWWAHESDWCKWKIGMWLIFLLKTFPCLTIINCHRNVLNTRFLTFIALVMQTARWCLLMQQVLKAYQVSGSNHQFLHLLIGLFPPNHSFLLFVQWLNKWPEEIMCSTIWASLQLVLLIPKSAWLDWQRSYKFFFYLFNICCCNTP